MGCRTPGRAMSSTQGNRWEIPRSPVTGSAPPHTLSHQATCGSGSRSTSSRSLPSCTPISPAGDPTVTTPTTSTPAGSRVSRSAAITVPRLWASSDDRP